jgi:hypothetical protein
LERGWGGGSRWRGREGERGGQCKWCLLLVVRVGKRLTVTLPPPPPHAGSLQLALAAPRIDPLLTRQHSIKERMCTNIGSSRPGRIPTATTTTSGAPGSSSTECGAKRLKSSARTHQCCRYCPPPPHNPHALRPCATLNFLFSHANLALSCNKVRMITKCV